MYFGEMLYMRLKKKNVAVINITAVIRECVSAVQAKEGGKLAFSAP